MMQPLAIALQDRQIDLTLNNHPHQSPFIVDA